MTAVLEVEGLRKRFRGTLFRRSVEALKGVDFCVRRGDIFGLLGPNGAGKSTAMYCFLGLFRPTAGSVRLNGERPEIGSALFEKVAYLPEEPHYPLYLTVEEALRYYASLYDTPIPPHRLEAALEEVGMAKWRKMRLTKCSKGMKQKLGIAASLINDPEVLFLDEPTRGLDPVIVKEFRDILLKRNRRGTTVILNSHVLSEVEMICNRVAILNKGEVILDGELEEILRVGSNCYEIRCSPFTDPPPSFTVLQKTETEWKGELPAGEIEEFIHTLTARGGTLFECRFRKRTLEEVFVERVREGEEKTEENAVLGTSAGAPFASGTVDEGEEPAVGGSNEEERG